MEKTFAMIKPDAVERNLIGKISERIEKEGFKIAAMEMKHLSLREAEGFYHVHKARPFFKDLTQYMASGPVVLLVLQRDNAIAKWREVMGATNPEQAAPGTLRKEVGVNIEKNATHGSDAPDTAAFEISYFFSHNRVYGN
jgi:nucleoside-diphosphate kinase